LRDLALLLEEGLLLIWGPVFVAGLELLGEAKSKVRTSCLKLRVAG